MGGLAGGYVSARRARAGRASLGDVSCADARRGQAAGHEEVRVDGTSGRDAGGEIGREQIAGRLTGQSSRRGDARGDIPHEDRGLARSCYVSGGKACCRRINIGLVVAGHTKGGRRTAGGHRIRWGRNARRELRERPTCDVKTPADAAPAMLAIGRAGDGRTGRTPSPGDASPSDASPSGASPSHSGAHRSGPGHARPPGRGDHGSHFFGLGGSGLPVPPPETETAEPRMLARARRRCLVARRQVVEVKDLRLRLDDRHRPSWRFARQARWERQPGQGGELVWPGPAYRGAPDRQRGRPGPGRLAVAVVSTAAPDGDVRAGRQKDDGGPNDEIARGGGRELSAGAGLPGPMSRTCAWCSVALASSAGDAGASGRLVRPARVSRACWWRSTVRERAHIPRPTCTTRARAQPISRMMSNVSICAP